MSTTSISLEAIADKVRRRRPLHNLKGELIALDSQQLAIVRHMCQGLQHKQIAAEIDICPRYVSMSLAGARKLTGCKTDAQLGVWAAKAGLV